MRQVPKKFILPLFFFFITLILSFQASAACTANFSNNYKLHGQRYAYGSIQLLNFHGNYCTMGREYGYLEKNNLSTFYQEIYTLLVVKEGYKYSALMQLAHKVYDHYPQRYKKILQGMSQTSGLSLQQHIFINAFEYILYFKTFKRQPGCSGIAVWNKVAQNNTLIFGRNYDYFAGYPQFKHMLTVTVFHPTNNTTAVAMLTFLGTLVAITDMNSHGLFLELNNGYPSGHLLPGGGVNYWHRPATPIDLLSLMFDSQSLKQLNHNIHTYKSSDDFIINVADAHQAESYEWSAHRLVLAHPPHELPGLMVSTNNFVDPSWHLNPKKEKMWATLKRRRHLLQLAKEDYAAGIPINVAAMKRIMQRRLINGGAKDVDTVYQVIAIPSKKIIWLRLPGFDDNWQQINLQPYFQH